MRKALRPANRLTFTFRSIAVLMMGLAGFSGAALYADAPASGFIISQVPAVVIGDAGDVESGDGEALHLLRYVNAVNLDFITNGLSSGGSSKLRFWYETTGQSLRITNSTAMKQPLTPSEVLALKSAAHTTPPLAKEITGGSDFWTSLIQDTKGNFTGSAKDATVAANGDTTESLTAAGALGNHRIMI